MSAAWPGAEVPVLVQHVRVQPRHDQPHDLHHLQRQLQEGLQEGHLLQQRGDSQRTLK